MCSADLGSTYWKGQETVPLPVRRDGMRLWQLARPSTIKTSFPLSFPHGSPTSPNSLSVPDISVILWPWASSPLLALYLNDTLVFSGGLPGLYWTPSKRFPFCGNISWVDLKLGGETTIWSQTIEPSELEPCHYPQCSQLLIEVDKEMKHRCGSQLAEHLSALCVSVCVCCRLVMHILCMLSMLTCSPWLNC